MAKFISREVWYDVGTDFEVPNDAFHYTAVIQPRPDKPGEVAIRVITIHRVPAEQAKRGN
jgi:hypothetical protein